MDIKEKIDMLSSKDSNKAYEIYKQLYEDSLSTDDLYKYIDLFIDMLDSRNSFIRTKGISLIIANSKWDNERKIDKIIDKLLNYVEDDKPITSRQCIKELPNLVKNKPELGNIVLKRLNSINKVYKDSMQHLIYEDRKRAINMIKMIINEKEGAL